MLLEEQASNDSFGRGASLAQRASAAILRRFSSQGVSGDLRQGTVLGVTLNTLCNVMGAGILSLPLAMHHASIAFGLALLTLCALASAAATYNVSCGCSVTGRESYAEVLAFVLWPERPPDVEADEASQEVAAIGEKRRRRNRRRILVLVEAIVFLNNFGALIIYSRVIADSIPPVVEHFLHGSGMWVQKPIWLLISGVCFFVLSCVRSMEELKWTSLLGFVTIMYVVVVIVIRFFTMSSQRPSSGALNWSHVTMDALRAMSAYGVAFGYHYNVPYFYKELMDRSPRKMMGSVAIAFPIIFVAYAATGVMGYVTFGPDIANEGGDIMNSFPKDDALVNVGRLGLFFHFACVFPVLSVCARRGLHRLLMIALKELGAAATGRGATAKPREGKPRGANEQSPLLPAELKVGHALATIHLADNTSGEHIIGPSCEGGAIVVRTSETSHSKGVPRHSRTHSRSNSHGKSELGPNAAQGVCLPPRSSSHGAATLLAPVDADDDDPGRPEDTTRLAIALEALVIVSGAVLLAAVVSGIDVVIDIIGTLFGLTLMLLVPGLIGVMTFSFYPPVATALGRRAPTSTENVVMPSSHNYTEGRGFKSSEAYSYFAATHKFTFATTSPVMTVVSWIVFLLGVGFVALGAVFMVLNAAGRP